MCEFAGKSPQYSSACHGKSAQLQILKITSVHNFRSFVHHFRWAVVLFYFTSEIWKGLHWLTFCDTSTHISSVIYFRAADNIRDITGLSFLFASFLTYKTSFQCSGNLCSGFYSPNYCLSVLLNNYLLRWCCCCYHICFKCTFSDKELVWLF